METGGRLPPPAARFLFTTRGASPLELPYSLTRVPRRCPGRPELVEGRGPRTPRSVSAFAKATAELAVAWPVFRQAEAATRARSLRSLASVTCFTPRAPGSRG